MKFSVVIPTYNGLEILKKCLPSVYEQCSRHPEFTEIILVDDASQDDSVNYVHSFSRIRSVKNKKNLGFSASVNRGVKESTAEIVFLLNNDIRVENDFISPVIRHFENPAVFAVQSKVFSFDGKTIEVGKAIPYKNNGMLCFKTDISCEHSCPTLFAGGGMSAFRRDTYLLLGGMNSLYYPFYWEDTALSYNAWKHGYTVMYEPESHVYHMGSATINNVSRPFYKEMIMYANRLVFSIAESDFENSLILCFFQIFRLAKSLLGNRVIRKGTLHAIKKLRQILRYRIFYHKCCRTDAEIFSILEQ